MTADPDAPFDHVWQARAFAVAQSLLDAQALDREEMRRRLVEALGENPERPYWDSWVIALERLVVHHGLISAEELTASSAASSR